VIPRSERSKRDETSEFREMAVRTTLFTKDEVNLVSLNVTGDACKLAVATFRVLDLPALRDSSSRARRRESEGGRRRACAKKKKEKKASEGS